jgi:hypothetical protein
MSDCRCPNCRPKTELGDKLAARIMLLDKSSKLYLPNESEWIGINLLERDDELPNLPKEATHVIHFHHNCTNSHAHQR